MYYHVVLGDPCEKTLKGVTIHRLRTTNLEGNSFLTSKKSNILCDIQGRLKHITTKHNSNNYRNYELKSTDWVFVY